MAALTSSLLGAPPRNGAVGLNRIALREHTRRTTGLHGAVDRASSGVVVRASSSASGNGRQRRSRKPATSAPSSSTSASTSASTSSPAARGRLSALASDVEVGSSARTDADSAPPPKRKISGVADPSVVYTGRSTGPLYTLAPVGGAAKDCGTGATDAEGKTECIGWQLSDGWRPSSRHMSKEELWQKIRREAQEGAAQEPALASFMHSSILGHKTLEKAMAFIIANKLESTTLLSTQIMRLILDVYEADPSIMEDCSADIQAVMERDPACESATQIMLFFKGFQAIQSHRVAHHLWRNDRRILAHALQSRLSEVFHVDIHPGAVLGRGLMIDHATGVVIGETAVVGDNVSMLHDVTLGGSGTGKDIRHPTIGHGALIGAGAVLLGPIFVGAGSKVGAGSVVLEDLPAHSVAVGVPARVVRTGVGREPCRDMNQMDFGEYDFII